jgi:PEP-CTERM motif-containing protein
MSRCRSFVLACVLICAFALPAESDFIQIQLEAGGMHLDGISGKLDVSAPGLSILADAGIFDSTHYPLGEDLRPGNVVSFSGSWIGTGGVVTWQGTTFSTGGSRDPLNEFLVSTPTIVVPSLGDPFTVVLPFTLTYNVRQPDFSLPALHAFGAGFATVEFEPDALSRGWLTREAVYRIGVVPEPATWLLVASGVLFPAGLRRRRKRSM